MFASRPRAALAAILCLAATMASAQAPQPHVLVFSRTAGYRHSSIASGIAAIQGIGRQQRFTVDATEDPTAFTDANLRRYRAVVFLNTTGDVLNPTQEAAFERFIQAGGGYVGIHSATDTEYQWPWYGQLAGAYFNGHPGDPNVRTGTFRVLDTTHVSTKGLPARWERVDEFYNFRAIDPTIRPLVDIDERSYDGGTNGANHPMSWYHAFDGGRAWYTAMGHTEASFTEPAFVAHLTGGLRYAMGTAPLDYRRARPEENRFEVVVLAESLAEPVELVVLPDARVLYIERRGAVKLYSPATGKVTEAGRIPVSLTYTNGDQAEDGLLGLAADPAFARTGWIYLYYSPVGPEPKNVLARYTMRGDTLDAASRAELLEVRVQRDQCCHTGGSIAFDAQGNLYVSTGDNTNPFATGYAPIDERPGRSPWDAQKSSGNTNDLRGKILRIHPEPDGSYTIPSGNLFAPGTPGTRPEVYTMGHRNPYRIQVDPTNGVLYWGDVGPDANVDSVGRGPAGQDEIGRAPRAGNYGWPYFVGDNKAYADVDHATMQAGPPFDPDHPVNDSPNNTGLRDLPPARKAFIWYPYGPSTDFPLVGSGGRTALAGPVIHRELFRTAERPWPTWYDGMLLTYDWMRGWIMAVRMDSASSFASMERFMPSTKWANPTDMAFGPNGDLYLLEYGTAWFQANADARLVRIAYNSGNRAPVAVAGADRTAGALPLRVTLSSKGTSDADTDSLRYAWTVTDWTKAVVFRSTAANPTLTLTRPGTYTATLHVRDGHGGRSTSRVLVAAGNAEPAVAIALGEGTNRTFYFPGVPVAYAVQVSDREDGTLAAGRIPEARVQVGVDYLADAPAGNAAAFFSPHAEGKALLEAGDCLACHKVNAPSVGPAYALVAERYAADTGAAARLARKVRAGGTGVWGKVMMPAHPQLIEDEAAKVVAYVLSLGRPVAARPSLPVQGTYVPPDSASVGTKGAIVLRASYTDRGANGVLGITSGASLVLRAPVVRLAEQELSDGAEKGTVERIAGEGVRALRSGAHVRLKAVDLTGIASMSLSVVAAARDSAQGGRIEVRLDAPDGPLLGTSALVPPAGTAPGSYGVPLQPVAGVHDVYLVARSEATGSRPLLVLYTTRVERAAGR